MTAPELRHVTVRTGKDVAVATIRPDEDAWLTVALDGEAFDVVNNAGSALYPGGYGGDRGFLERDAGQYDAPAEVFAWCGGAVLLSKAYLDDVGLFDERLFLYYEDTDLSWRGRLRGWRYVYEPTSRGPSPARRVVRRSGSAVFRYYTERNRVLMLAKNAPPRSGARPGALSPSGPSVERPRPADAATHPAWAVAAERTPPARVLVGYLRCCRRCCATGGVRRRSSAGDRCLAWTINEGDGADDPPPRSASTTCTGRPWAAASRSPARSPRRCPPHHDVTLLGPDRVDVAVLGERLGVDVTACSFDTVRRRRRCRPRPAPSTTSS